MGGRAGATGGEGGAGWASESQGRWRITLKDFQGEDSDTTVQWPVWDLPEGRQLHTSTWGATIIL